MTAALTVTSDAKNFLSEARTASVGTGNIGFRLLAVVLFVRLAILCYLVGTTD